MKSFIYIVIIGMIFISLNCYTKLEKNSSDKTTRLPYNNHKIIGAWIHKVPMMDSNGELKRIEFFVDGDVTFCPNGELNNLINQTGNFIIQNDTLIIKLFNNDFEERFIYSMDNSDLILEDINNSHYNKYPIQNGGKVRWEKVIF